MEEEPADPDARERPFGDLQASLTDRDEPPLAEEVSACVYQLLIDPATTDEEWEMLLEIHAGLMDGIEFMVRNDRAELARTQFRRTVDALVFLLLEASRGGRGFDTGRFQNALGRELTAGRLTPDTRVEWIVDHLQDNLALKPGDLIPPPKRPPPPRPPRAALAAASGPAGSSGPAARPRDTWWGRWRTVRRQSPPGSSPPRPPPR